MAKLISLVGVEVLVLAAIGIAYLAYAVYKWRSKRREDTRQQQGD